MNKRIKELRKLLRLTQKEFGNRIGIKPNTVATYEIGRNIPIDAVVSLICREFNVSETWLRTGVGDIFIPKEIDAWDEVVKRRGLSNNDKLLIEKFMNLKSSEREMVMNYILSVAADYVAPNTFIDTRPRNEKPVKDWTEQDIEDEVEEYRCELLAEKKQAEKSSDLSDTNEKMT